MHVVGLADFMNELKANKPAILIIEDDPQTSRTIADFLQLRGNITSVAGTGREGLALLEKNSFDVVLVDLGLPDLPGIQVLAQVKADHPFTEAIVLTGNLSLDTAVECMKEGACDYLVKPLDFDKLIISIARAVELRSLNDEIDSLKQSAPPAKLANEKAFAQIITRNMEMRQIFRYIEVIGISRQPVLITGETGVGKELFASTIHEVSGCPGDFVAVNAAGLDDMMFSDTLFGHKKGSYTGADSTREGLIAKAAEGTLFLDEIGDLTANSQTKLLRLLQEHEYYRLGSDTPLKSNARLVVATNRDLKELMAMGEFRKDLYYRLCTHTITIPPLRQRTDDISLLLDHFIARAAHAMGKKAPSYPPELVTLLSTYEFPGNVRELQAMVFDTVARNDSRKLPMAGFKRMISKERDLLPITPGLLEPEVAAANDNSCGRFPTLKEAETHLINRALELARGNQGVAASLLGISRQALNKRLRRSS